MIELIKPDVENKRFKRIIFLGLDNAGKTYISRRFSKDILEYQYNPYDLYLSDEVRYIDRLRKIERFVYYELNFDILNLELTLRYSYDLVSQKKRSLYIIINRPYDRSINFNKIHYQRYKIIKYFMTKYGYNYIYISNNLIKRRVL